MKARDLLAACFVLFGLLLTWPVLVVANRPIMILGVSLLALYLFAVWIAIVVVLFVVARRLGTEEPS